MPADIRSFFGGKPAPTPIGEKPTVKEEDSKKNRGKARKIIEDSDDEDEVVPVAKKSTPKPVPKKAVKESPKGQETSTSDYFASSSKPKAAKLKAEPRNKVVVTPANGKNGRPLSHRRTTTSHTEIRDDGDDGSGEDALAADAKLGKRMGNDYMEIDSDVEVLSQPKKAVSKVAVKPDKSSKTVAATPDVDNYEGDSMIFDESVKTTSKKRKSLELESESDEDDDVSVKSKKKSEKPPAAKKPRAARKKQEPVGESAAVQAILDSIPSVRAPTPPPKDVGAKFDWKKAGGGGNAGPPPGAGAGELPAGADNCLAGMAFVFTGLLNTISREEGQELVKRHGGKVTTAPSSKTTAVILGNDAGPSKLRKIQELKIRTYDEEGLFALIRSLPKNGGDGKAAEKINEKKKAEAEKIKRDAEKMEKEEQRKLKESEKAEEERQKQAAMKGSTISAAPIRPPPPTSQLLTSKYAPTMMNQICGNKGQVEKIEKWLKGWPKAHKYNFQMRGADGLGGARAIIIHGPPGIGKTTAAHLAAKLAGYDIIESNASDTRSKKMVESGVSEVLNNKSLLGFFASDGKDVNAQKKNIVLIMDEVDGMSAGDRGGVGALAKVCKTTHIPMILICNERKQPKMKPFDHITFDMPFRRPTVEQVRSRIATICLREGLKLPMPVIDALIEGSNKDIRQIINMIATAKLDQTAMDFDQGKSMTKAWEKHVVLKPWDICHKLLGGGMFAPNSKATLNDKIELYFNDHEFTPLMIQENYLSMKPMLLNSATSAKKHKLQTMRLFDQAAEAISDGDLVDRMIHGSQQQWGLMPTHAVFSTVRPASFVSGMMTGQTGFTKWLGNNSKYGKLTRYVKEIQSHMRLRTSGDRHEIRQQYLPVLWTRMIKRLEQEGKDCVDEVIDLMDSYFLTRDDFDYMMELGLGDQDEENVKLETQTKAAFTRLYNVRSHPLPFIKATNAAAPPAAKKAAPDLEEAFEEENDAEIIAGPKDDDEGDELDLKKDKYIKAPKAKKVPVKKKAPAKKKGPKEADEEEEDEDNENIKPKKGKANVKPKPKAAPKAQR
ncbi:replication factor RFC1 C terminal domain-containing protein [Calycina marina]|uniref:Replication factor C subunit 1 n=1 Tax=Calycina marina TaxID=1763456 RepID=A0A9P7Z7W1_9HELO|nr:replication factor RFC1 C terminal domain-containing protein [Calycina marina]